MSLKVLASGCHHAAGCKPTILSMKYAANQLFWTNRRQRRNAAVNVSDEDCLQSNKAEFTTTWLSNCQSKHLSDGHVNIYYDCKVNVIKHGANGFAASFPSGVRWRSPAMLRYTKDTPWKTLRASQMLRAQAVRRRHSLLLSEQRRPGDPPSWFPLLPTSLRCAPRKKYVYILCRHKSNSGLTSYVVLPLRTFYLKVPFRTLKVTAQRIK